MHLLIPAAYVVLGALAGLVLDRVLMSRVRSASASRGWKGGEATAHSLAGMGVLFGALAGAWLAAESLDLAERSARIVNIWLLVAAVAVATVVVARLATQLALIYTSRDGTLLRSSTILVNIIRIAVIAVGVLIGLNAVGLSITPLLTALGVGGLAVALALQDTLSNLFSGLQLVGSRQLGPGQYISLESGEEGYVEDVTWRFTSIRQLSNNLVIVPNAKLANSRMVNYDTPEREMSVLLQVGVAYDSDLELVERVTIETATEVIHRLEGPIEGFTPLVRFHTFGSSAIEFTVVLRVTGYVRQYELKHEFVKALKSRYDAEGIEIPFPQRAVTVTTA